MLEDFLHPLPLIAILRGVKPDEAIAIGKAVVRAGIRVVEVPLNSPSPLESISSLHKEFGDDILIGAGTVLSVIDAVAVAEAGGQLIVAPNVDVEVIGAAADLELICLPGAMTPTECFAALAAGADGVKLFPAEMISPSVVKAMRAVLPPATMLFPVGGITPINMEPYIAAGATGFGLGSALYKPGMSPDDVFDNANRFRSSLNELLPY